MAESLRPPGHLEITDGNVSENFKKWKRQMQIYLSASGALAKDKKIQTSIILHCAGPKVIEIYDQFEWEEEDHKDDPEVVLGEIENYCNFRKNEVIESHRFWSLKFDEFPSFEHFLTELRKRAESCNFLEMDRMMRDKIVLSTSGKLQELLLREDKLDLTKCLKISRAFEQSNKHVQEIRRDQSNVNRVDNQKLKAKPKKPANAPRTQKTKIKCKFCGYEHEKDKKKCPAWGEKCLNCNGRNHFKSCCKKVHSVEEQSDEDEEEFWLQYIDSTVNSKVQAKMMVNQCEVKFQIDTGAEINTIQQRFVRKCQRVNRVANLRMWNKSTMKSLGEATLKVTNPLDNSTHNVKFVIVPNELECLLGLKTVQQMNLVTINTDQFVHSVKEDLGDLGYATLKTTDDAIPKALPARNIPLAVKSEVKDEIDHLVERGILIPVTEPTEWVSQMAITKKSNGSWRICLDPQPLNKVLVRERYRLPTFDDIVPQLNNAKIFTKLDVREAYWHVRLDEKSSYLTTMITPFGRFRWARLPFGLKVSSEIFQRKLHENLSELEGIFTIADDIIVAGCGNDEKAARSDNERKVDKLFERCRERHIVLNDSKKEIGTEIKFHGHRITPQGIKPDEDKVKAVLEMKTPGDVTEVKRFCGLVQYMAKFLPNLSEILEPIRNLTRKSIPWKWTKECTEAFEKVKHMIVQTDVLVYYDPSKELTLQVDSSKEGLGAVLLQEGRPLEYASRSLKPAERNWAQIEKEALSVLYGLERFDQYTYGRRVVVENDHKPLETILRKPLSQAPKRLQDIIMKLYRYDIEFKYVKGTDLIIADTLSRAYITSDKDELKRTRICQVNVTDKISDARITEIRDETSKDPTLQLLLDYVVNGWPEQKCNVKSEAKPYYSIRDTLSHCDGVILKSEAVLIPFSLRKKMKEQLHSAHLGYDSMLRRAQNTIFWIGMNREIRELAENCHYCMELKPKVQREPLKQHDDGCYPWEKIGLDLFEIKGHHYLLAIDYYSNFIEVESLTKTTTEQVIEKLKKQFARFGIPNRIISDCGPQFTSHDFKEFVQKYSIQHHVTSPHHPQSNGKAEAGVKIMKTLMVKCVNSKTDPYQALLEQRNTPRQDTGLSPAEMMFGRCTRTIIPNKPANSTKNSKREKRKQSVKKSYDKSAKKQPELKEKQPVYFKHLPDTAWRPGLVKASNKTNSTVTSTENVSYDRHRVHIRPTKIPVMIRDRSPNRSIITGNSPMSTDQCENNQEITPEQLNPTSSRPKRTTREPAYLKDYVRK